MVLCQPYMGDTCISSIASCISYPFCARRNSVILQTTCKQVHVSLCVLLSWASPMIERKLKASICNPPHWETGFILEISRWGPPSVILGGPFSRKGAEKGGTFWPTEKAWTRVIAEFRIFVFNGSCVYKWWLLCFSYCHYCYIYT